MVAPIPMPPPPRQTPVLDAARWYVRAGFSVLPIRADGSKAPDLKAGEVEQYRERQPDDGELQRWFAPHRAVGVALVCGKISGNLAVLDFESQAAWDTWLTRVADTAVAAAVAVSPIVRTPKGGRHVYWRIPEGWVAGGPLARRDPKTLLIEVRGQGHYVLAPGCPPACHQLNLPYTWEAKGWLADAR